MRRHELDIYAIKQRIPEIMGMNLVWKNNGWQGGYYIRGERHPYRKDKLKVRLWDSPKGKVFFVHEEGGESMSLQTWLIKYGGAEDYKQAMEILEGNCTPKKELLEYIRPKEGAYVDEAIYEEYRAFPLESCNLYNFMCRLFGEVKVRKAWERYNVTSDSNGDCVFWYRDTEGRLLHDKIMRYSMQGKRDKTYISRRFKVGDGFNQKCWFGSHLIKDGDDLHCVESEKSALIMSIVEPEKLWVASGGLSNIRDVDSHIWLYPDIDGIERWSAINNAQIVEWWNGENVGDHDDIADLVLRKIKRGDVKL